MDRKKVSLVIMAAGLGSRYGGSKQVDGIGPGGEILMEYSIHDALRAGFDRVVFIIKPEMEALLRGMVGYLENRRTLAGDPVEVRYVFQDFSSVPAFYRIPEGRTKPFGTVHALLCAEEAVDGPFCVINADDYYGIDAYRTIYEELVKLPEDGKATTGTDGIAKWEGLALGAQYRVTELKAPAGYILLPEPVSVDALTAAAPDITVTLCNNAGFVLPFTGGRGFAAPILFAALMLGMGVYFCKKSEFKKENN